MSDPFAMRGKTRPTSATEAVQRWLSCLTMIPTPPDPSVEEAGHRPFEYRLEEMNGGKDPYAPHPADWSFGGRTPTIDCVGFVLWGAGIDRYQPTYKGVAGHWLYCPSIVDDAKHGRVYFEEVEDDDARSGDILVDSEHIAGVIRPAIYVVGSQRFDHLVIDCSPRHGRKTAVGIGLPWSQAAFVARPKFYTR